MLKIERIKKLELIRYGREIDFLLEKLEVLDATIKIEKYIEDDSCILLGAVDKNKLIGILWAYERSFGNSLRYHINYFIVLEEERSKGIGKKLLKKLEKIALENDIEKIDLNVSISNIKAQNFYKNNLFHEEKILYSLDLKRE